MLLCEGPRQLRFGSIVTYLYFYESTGDKPWYLHRGKLPLCCISNIPLGVTNEGREAISCLVEMVSDNSIVFRGVRKGDLYIVDFSKDPQVATCLLARATECWLWHRRLRHAVMRNLQKLVLKKHVLGIEEIRFTKDRLYGAWKLER